MIYWILFVIYCVIGLAIAIAIDELDVIIVFGWGLVAPAILLSKLIKLIINKFNIDI